MFYLFTESNCDDIVLCKLIHGPLVDMNQKFQEWIVKQIGVKPDWETAHWNKAKSQLKYHDFVKELEKEGYTVMEYETVNLDGVNTDD